MDNNIPTKKYAYDWFLEVISLLSLICTFIPLCFYNKMSKNDLFPIHYNLHGKADGWGNRKFLLYFVLIALVLYIYLTLSEKFYKRFLYPIKVNKENESQIYRLGIRLRRHVKLFTMLIFCYMSNSFLYMMIHNTDSQPCNLLLTWLMGALIAVIAGFYMMMMAYKKTHE